MRYKVWYTIITKLKNMIKIDFVFLKNWKWWKQFDDVYRKQVNIVWKLDKSYLIQDDFEMYDFFSKSKNEYWYIYLTDIKNPDEYRPIFIWDTLKLLLEKSGYIDYEWNIRIYWKFDWLPVAKTNIWQIWKADILDEKWNIIDSFENPELKPKES